MPRKKKAAEGAQPSVCAECKESAEGVYRLAISFGCDKHGMTKLLIKDLVNNQQAFITLFNWYIDLAGPDILAEVQRLATEGNRRAMDALKIREEMV